MQKSTCTDSTAMSYGEGERRQYWKILSITQYIIFRFECAFEPRSRPAAPGLQQDTSGHIPFLVISAGSASLPCQ